MRQFAFARQLRFEVHFLTFRCSVLQASLFYTLTFRCFVFQASETECTEQREAKHIRGENDISKATLRVVVVVVKLTFIVFVTSFTFSQ